MVDFKSKIKAQKAKDRKRAGKKTKSVEVPRTPSAAKAPIPSAIQRKDNSAALTKGITDLFKDKDIGYDTYDDIIPEDAFGNLDSFSASGSGSFGGGIPVTDMSTLMSVKKGGRLKNAGKRKRAALRGQRSELRGS
jgi:hypothetical protein